MDPISELMGFVAKVSLMRRAQRGYATRNAGITLAQVRSLEREVDHMAAYYLDGPIPFAPAAQVEQPAAQVEPVEQPAAQVEPVEQPAAIAAEQLAAQVEPAEQPAEQPAEVEQPAARRGRRRI